MNIFTLECTAASVAKILHDGGHEGACSGGDYIGNYSDLCTSSSSRTSEWACGTYTIVISVQRRFLEVGTQVNYWKLNLDPRGVPPRLTALLFS